MNLPFASEARVSYVLQKITLLKNDMAAKSRKKHKNKISGLIISMGYETEIRGF
jgi:hypothetical protein